MKKHALNDSMIHTSFAVTHKESKIFLYVFFHLLLLQPHTWYNKKIDTHTDVELGDIFNDI